MRIHSVPSGNAKQAFGFLVMGNLDDDRGDEDNHELEMTQMVSAPVAHHQLADPDEVLKNYTKADLRDMLY